jgi:erythromycin esterase-like protein
MEMLPSLATETIRKAAICLSGSEQDYSALLDRIGDARFVLIGEASHGTHASERGSCE